MIEQTTFEMEKISDLDTLTTADNSDILVINDVSEGDTMKITKQNLLKEVNTELSYKATTSDLTALSNEIYSNVYTQTAVNSLIQKHILTATISSDVTLTTNSNTPLTLVLSNSVGSKLSVSNGAIVIGSGVSKVLISGKGQYNTMTSSTNQRYFKIKKNDVEVLVGRTSSPNNTFGLAISLPSILLDVSPGDEITASIQGTTGDVFRSTNIWTYVTIEVVE